LFHVDVAKFERCNRAVACAGQYRERNQRAVPALDVGDRGHGLDDVPNLFQGWNFCRAGGFGDPRVLSRKVEVFGVRIRDAGLVAGLPGEPDEKSLQGSQRSIKRRLAQWFAASAALVREAAFKFRRDETLRMA
jgi:hypothetical protein